MLNFKIRTHSGSFQTETQLVYLFFLFCTRIEKQTSIEQKSLIITMLPAWQVALDLFILIEILCGCYKTIMEVLSCSHDLRFIKFILIVKDKPNL